MEHEKSVKNVLVVVGCFLGNNRRCINVVLENFRFFGTRVKRYFYHEPKFNYVCILMQSV